MAVLALAAAPSYAQDQQASISNAVPAGTRFLVRLTQPLSTKDSKAGDHFDARTLEPLVLPDGTAIRAGAEISGHVDKVESAHAVGRAKIWLAFDDISTPQGPLPLVAVVSDIPGVHSIRVNYNREGEIEASTSKNQEAVEAALAGAMVGAAPGVVSHSGKDAAYGAAAGAVTAFMLASGLGQELTLDQGLKLELVLGRPLYLDRS